MKSLVLLITIMLFSFSTISEELTVNPKVVQSIKEKGQVLYQQLVTLKTDPEFLARGLSDPKSKEWYNNVQSLESECVTEIQKLPMRLRFSGKLSSLCEAANYMHKIGLHYAKHKSVDDNFTNTVKKQVKSVFGKGI